ncbi:MAG: universal stress protein [Thermodesulfovibrionales bacterium]|nr:universal stress protein [Thermodesulfovibrionales bacterium]
MYKKILAAMNEHLNSEVTARYAMNLARVSGARLFLCFVAEKEMTASTINRAKEAVKRIFLEAGKIGIEIEAITETGDPVKKIGELVRGEGIDIVFASTRKEDIERRFFAGTVARRLSLSLPCSVAIVRVVHTGRIRPREILVPLKARIDHVEERAYFTAEIAEAFGSEVFIFHSPEAVSKFFHGEIHLTPIEWEEKLPKDISEFMEHMKRYRIAHAGRSVPGSIGRMIAIEAFSKRHDLIIMGASQRSLLSSILRGNPVEEVLRNTPCDLVILKPRREG